ncbi:hypothetical protein EOS93_00355 [Rhizobium sp. RMa-01]|nr:hypothetical protein EOS93_00355 [Rhizobium sp. RMa-01]
MWPPHPTLRATFSPLGRRGCKGLTLPILRPRESKWGAYPRSERILLCTTTTTTITTVTGTTTTTTIPTCKPASKRWKRC